MSFARAARAQDVWEQLEARMASAIKVEINAQRWVVQKDNGDDTFHWVVGPEVRKFHDDNNIKVLANLSDIKEAVFHFPQERKDIAALFKLTFA